MKTATRRQWDRARVTVGSIQQCKLGRDMMKKDCYFAKVRITDVYMQALMDMQHGDYDKEGGYTRETFIETWKRINGHYDPKQTVYVIEFELVE